VVDWGKLLIRTDGPEIPEMLGYWDWKTGPGYHPLVMSKFGDWFLADPQGKVHWLELLEGTFNCVANSVEEFEQLMVQTAKLNEWFWLPWCYKLHDDGLIPQEGQCFGFKVPPKLGAPADLSNVEVANLPAYQFWMSQIHKIPPGTVVDAITINGKMP
jgi:hypothetical protein